jgi:hypothetical protein
MVILLSMIIIDAFSIFRKDFFPPLAPWHPDLAPEADREPDIPVQQAQCEVGRVCWPVRNLWPSRSKVRTRPVAPGRTAAHKSTGSTPALTTIVKTSANATPRTALVRLCTSLAIVPAPFGPI